jgi:CBS domain
MKLKDIMTEKVEVVGPDSSLYEAARKMRDLDVGALPVCDPPVGLEAGSQLKSQGKWLGVGGTFLWDFTYLCWNLTNALGHRSVAEPNARSRRAQLLKTRASRVVNSSRPRGNFGRHMRCKPTKWERSLFGQNGLLGQWQQQTQQQKIPYRKTLVTSVL